MFTFIRRVLPYAIMALFIGGCAASETADEPPEPEAVEPAPDEADDASAQGDPQQMRRALDESVVDGEEFARLADETADEEVRKTLDVMGVLPTAGRCDGGPCEVCEIGDREVFELADTPLAVRTCCVDGDHCFSEIYFGDDDTTIGVIDGALEAHQFSVRARWLVVATEAHSEADGDLFAVETDGLRHRAGPVDEPTPVVDTDELRRRAQWSLDVSRLHRVEALSARAVEEAQHECGDGHHLPTLLALADEATPLTKRLDVVFERWTERGVMVFTTRADGAGETTMYVDPDTECMERYDTSYD